ncbi:MAG: helix-turn-helix domain-containing protein [Chthoniobacterales bacterium]
MTDSPGKRLQAARAARDLSVEDIVSTTKMRPSVILALEADDYTQFPSITHARNFLALYGKHLKVDVKDGLARLTTPARIGIENYQYLNVERSDDTSFRPQRRMHTHSAPRGGDQTLRTLGIIGGIVLFLMFAVYLSVNLRRLNLAGASSAAPGSPGNPAASPAESSPTPLTAPPPLPSLNTTRPTPPGPSTTPFYPRVQKDHPLIHTPPPTPF